MSNNASCGVRSNRSICRTTLYVAVGMWCSHDWINSNAQLETYYHVCGHLQSSREAEQVYFRKLSYSEYRFTSAAHDPRLQDGVSSTRKAQRGLWPVIYLIKPMWEPTEKGLYCSSIRLQQFRPSISRQHNNTCLNVSVATC